MSSEMKVTRRLQWTVPMHPIAQKRHRHTRQGRTYDLCAADKVKFRRRSIAECEKFLNVDTSPMSMKFVFSCARPQAHYTTKKRLKLSSKAPVHHVYKPDIDNYVKFVMDALCGTFYSDDSQVFSIDATKRWVDEGNQGVYVELISYEHT